MRFLRSEKPNIAAAGTLFSRQEIKKLLIPLIIEQLLSYLVGLADSVMVATAGNAAVSAVSLVDSISVLMVNIFAALAAGGAIVVGQYLGLRSEDQARKAGQQLLMALLVLSVLLTALLIAFEGGILHLLFGKSDVEVQENCRIYYHIVMLSVPFIALYNGAAALYRAVGNSRVPMRISMLMNIINIVGNGVLIYGFRMGVAGVAIPTLVSRGVAMVVQLIWYSGPSSRCLCWRQGGITLKSTPWGRSWQWAFPTAWKTVCFRWARSCCSVWYPPCPPRPSPPTPSVTPWPICRAW